MIGRFWRRAPWWIAGGVAALALFDLQFSIAGKALTVVAIAIGLAGVLVAPLADAMLLAIADVAVSRRRRAARRDACPTVPSGEKSAPRIW